MGALILSGLMATWLGLIVWYLWQLNEEEKT